MFHSYHTTCAKIRDLFELYLDTEALEHKVGNYRPGGQPGLRHDPDRDSGLTGGEP